MDSIGHTFYQILDSEEKQMLFLESSVEYDTLSPYKYCSNQLYRLNEQIKKGVKLKIITNLPYDPILIKYIDTPDAFYHWIKNIFKGGFETTYKSIMN